MAFRTIVSLSERAFHIQKGAAKPLGRSYSAILCRRIYTLRRSDPAIGAAEGVDKSFPEGVTPECFYRGSSPELAWIPA
jgi:hypothetical protein